MPQSTAKDLVVTAITALFIDRDPAALDRYWSPAYRQHNPHVPNGLDGLRGLLGAVGPDFSYQIGFVATDGDIVMVHGRYTGTGEKPVIAVDIFRVVDGKIAEHWDVLQDEVTETANGNPMFDAAEGSTVARTS